MPHPDQQEDEQGLDERRAIFKQKIECLLDRLYGTALRLTRDPYEAEDVVAESVSKAWASLDQLDDPHSMEPWLFRILNNTFVSHWRRQRRRQEMESESFTDEEDLNAERFSLFRELHQPFLLWWGTPEQQLLNTILREDLQCALDNLPDAFRHVVVLIEVQGYTYEEAAEILRTPLGTIRSRLNRGRGLLQKALWKQARAAGLVADSGNSSGERP